MDGWQVHIVDFRRVSPLLPVLYYRCMIPEVALTVSPSGHFYHQEAIEEELLSTHQWPFCGTTVSKAAWMDATQTRQTDEMDVCVCVCVCLTVCRRWIPSYSSLPLWSDSTARQTDRQLVLCVWEGEMAAYLCAV